MVREFRMEDLDSVMEIWLNTNISAHSFIDRSYWEDNFDYVRSAIAGADVYIYEHNGEVLGFLGISDGYIAGIFVEERCQSLGAGRELIDCAKRRYDRLSLNVYRKNKGAVRFYKREGFIISDESIDEINSELEYAMVWNRDE